MPLRKEETMKLIASALCFLTLGCVSVESAEPPPLPAFDACSLSWVEVRVDRAYPMPGMNLLAASHELLEFRRLYRERLTNECAAAIRERQT